MRRWIKRVWVMVLSGAMVSGLMGCGHNPNHGIDMEKARAAAHRVKPPPKSGEKSVPGHGG